MFKIPWDLKRGDETWLCKASVLEEEYRIHASLCFYVQSLSEAQT